MNTRRRRRPRTRTIIVATMKMAVLAGVLIGSIMMVVLVQEVWYVVVTVQSQVLEVRFLLRLEPSVHLSMGCWRSQAPSLRPMLMWHLGC